MFVARGFAHCAEIFELCSRRSVAACSCRLGCQMELLKARCNTYAEQARCTRARPHLAQAFGQCSGASSGVRELPTTSFEMQCVCAMCELSYLPEDFPGRSVLCYLCKARKCTLLRFVKSQGHINVWNAVSYDTWLMREMLATFCTDSVNFNIVHYLTKYFQTEPEARSRFTRIDDILAIARAAAGGPPPPAGGSPPPPPPPAGSPPAGSPAGSHVNIVIEVNVVQLRNVRRRLD